MKILTASVNCDDHYLPSQGLLELLSKYPALSFSGASCSGEGWLFITAELSTETDITEEEFQRDVESVMVEDI